MFVDMPLAQLREYRPTIPLPDDFDEFWAGQIATAHTVGAAMGATFRPVPAPLAAIDVYDVTFPGHDAAPIKGWLLMPQRAAAGAPVIVEYVGYNGGRGEPLDWLLWASCGLPHVVMDSRGQGGGWRTADTADIGSCGEPGSTGFLTRGIGCPQHHYYTRLMVDAARVIDAVRAEPLLAGRPVVTAGASQGGGLAIAAAHLAGDVAGCLPDVPFLSDVRRAAEITDAGPYAELADYCRLRPAEAERALTTLSYLDVANHALRASSPALFSVALRDEITPPSTVFAAYQQYAGRKDIAVYPFNGHEGGGTVHRRAQLEFLGGLFPGALSSI
jgi:cephalosporin-C deacetylase